MNPRFSPGEGDDHSGLVRQGIVQWPRGGVEPPASQALSLGGLRVAYRAKSSAALSKSSESRPASVGRVPGGSRTRLSGLEDRRLGRSATGTSLAAEGEGVEPSRLVARPGSGRMPSPVGLPFRLSVWMAGFEPAWPGTRGRRMKPGSPTSRALFAPSPRPTKKARGRVTPGLESRRPVGSGVTAVGGTR